MKLYFRTWQILPWNVSIAHPSAANMAGLGVDGRLSMTLHRRRHNSIVSEDVGGVSDVSHHVKLTWDSPRKVYIIHCPLFPGVQVCRNLTLRLLPAVLTTK